jgi:hypothetical protein
MNGTAIRIAPLAAIALALALPMPGAAQNSDILDSDRIMLELLLKHSARLRRVDTYVQRIKKGEIENVILAAPDGSPVCASNCRVFKVEEVTDGGTTIRQERLLTAPEVMRLAGVSPEAASLDLFSAGLIGTQDVLNQEFDRSGASAGMSQVGMPRDDGATGLEEGQPWLSPYRLMASGSVVTSAAADSVGEADRSLATSQAQAQDQYDRMSELFAGLENVGTETIDGRQTTHLQSRGANIPMEGDPAQDPRMTGADVWADTAAGVIVRHRMIGEMTENGQTREFSIDVRYSDFREVPGCDLYEPYRREMRMGGMLNEEQMAQMAEARQQLEEFERQMASLPPDQRAMAERMMGDRMDMVRSMASGGAVETVEEIEEIVCNPDLAALFGGGAATVTTSPEQLLRQIQLDLGSLGYEPGNTNGVLDTMTQIAISQYQAEAGLEVTGEPSATLASSLASAVGRQ